ncbi:MAG: hypothetical protein J2P17_01865 [Mycobacterium sp.]|nr:hypothetical protein [Mycobacterium sp.]
MNASLRTRGTPTHHSGPPWIATPLPEPPPHQTAVDSAGGTADPGPLRALSALEFTFAFATVISFPYLIELVGVRLPGVAPVLAGVLFALPHLVYLVLATAVQRRMRTGPGRPIVLGFACLAVGLGAHTVVWSLMGFMVARLLLGVGLTLCLVGRNMLASECARGRAPGGMFGPLEFFSKAGGVTAGVAATVATFRFGPAAPTLVGGVAALAALTVALTLNIRRALSAAGQVVVRRPVSAKSARCRPR